MYNYGVQVHIELNKKTNRLIRDKFSSEGLGYDDLTMGFFFDILSAIISKLTNKTKDKILSDFKKRIYSVVLAPNEYSSKLTGYESISIILLFTKKEISQIVFTAVENELIPDDLLIEVDMTNIQRQQDIAAAVLEIFVQRIVKKLKER